jgi:SAM-dependent methyltransferase
MAHRAQQDFCISVRHQFQHHFLGKKVVDFGSLDINGCNRGLFFDCDYLGIDLGPGKNVDLVSPAHLAPLQEGTFDVVVSTECLEHDRYWQLTLKKAYDVLKAGGLFFFSCATTGRGEHGTTRSDLGSSPFTLDYYQNLTEIDVRNAYREQLGKEVEELFNPLLFETPDHSADLYFRGIKR